jgi:hypothetical protein
MDNGTARGLAGALLVVGLITSACGSAQPNPAPAPESSTGARPTPSADPGGGVAVSAVTAETGTFADQGGNKATVTIRVGALTPLSGIDQHDFNYCGGLTAASYQAAKSVALPLTVDVTLTSSRATPVDLGLTALSLSSDGSSDGHVDLGWATAPGNAARCSAGALSWSTVAPRQTVSWRGWVFAADVITPDDPAGSPAQLTVLESKFAAGFGQNAETVHVVPNIAASHNLVQDQDGTDNAQVLAFNPTPPKPPTAPPSNHHHQQVSLRDQPAC